MKHASRGRTAMLLGALALALAVAAFGGLVLPQLRADVQMATTAQAPDTVVKTLPRAAPHTVGCDKHRRARGRADLRV